MRAEVADPGATGSARSCPHLVGVLKVAGEQLRLRGVRVTFKLRLVDPSLGAVVDLKPTFAAVWMGWRWAWMLPAARYEMYLTHSC